MNLTQKIQELAEKYPEVSKDIIKLIFIEAMEYLQEKENNIE